MSIRPTYVLFLPLAMAALLLPACGNGDTRADDLRIRVETLSIDGPVPEGLHAVILPGDGGPETRYALVPVPDGRPGEYAIRGGPEGACRVEPPEGWGVISGSYVPPEVRRGRTPPVVRVGRAATLYLGPLAPTLRPGTVWGGERLEDDGSRVRLEVRAEVVPPGYVVGLRFDPAAWHGTIEVVGRLARGLPGAAPADALPGPLAEPLRVRVPADGGPVIGRLRTAPVSHLQVIPVPASPQVDVDGLPVVVSLLGLPIVVSREAPVYRGAARFAALPALEKLLEVRVGADGFRFLLSPDAWERSSQVRLLWTDEVPTRTVRVKIPASVVVDAVQVRPAAAVAYGRVPFEREGDEVVLKAPRGTFSLLLRAGRRWATASGAGETDLSMEAPPFVDGVRFDGEVRGALPTCEIRFFRRVGTGEEAVLADGFVVRLSRFGAYEAELPPGTYVVEVADEQGVEARATPLDATTPGVAIHLPLHAKGH